MTGLHEVINHGQMTLLSCIVYGCEAAIICIKEVILHLWGKVLCNVNMATQSTRMKGIQSTL